MIYTGGIKENREFNLSKTRWISKKKQPFILLHIAKCLWKRFIWSFNHEREIQLHKRDITEMRQTNREEFAPMI